MYEDKTLVCKDCGAEFVFTAGEQEFYAEKGFQNEPTRCKACRQARKASRAAGAPRQMYDAVCAECGKPTQVPFEPKEDRPVYCSECFAARRVYVSSKHKKIPGNLVSGNFFICPDSVKCFQKKPIRLPGAGRHPQT